MMITRRRIAAVLAGLLLTVSTRALAADPPSIADRPLTIADPYIRATPPGQTNTAMFLTLTNHTDRQHALIAASSLLADRVELHAHRMENGLAMMRPVQRIAIPAGESVTLQPGGLHVMLLGIRRPIQPGDCAAVTFTFETGDQIQVTAPIRRIRHSDIAPHDRRH